MEGWRLIRALVRGRHGTPGRPRPDEAAPPYNELAGQDLGRLAGCRWVMLRPERERCPEDANARR